MTTVQRMVTILAVILGTMLTRFLPFLLFPEQKTPPAYITRLGRVLPQAVMGLLVVYALKDSFGSWSAGLPALAGVLAVVLVHKWRHSTLLSIGAGTVLYMFLLQTWLG